MNSIALALSGGGARGLAHIGVLKVLEREGIRVQALAGTSMGGLIAAFYASGISAIDIEQIACEITQPRSLVRLFNLSRGMRGLIDTRRIRGFLEEFLGEASAVENLPVPLTLIAVDLLCGQETVISSGNLVQAVLATTAVPGVFAPVEIEGRELIDGGVLNNLPADAARRMCAPYSEGCGCKVPCVAVDVAPTIGESVGTSGEHFGYTQTSRVATSPAGRSEVTAEGNHIRAWTNSARTGTGSARAGTSPAPTGWPRFIPSFGRDLFTAEVIMTSALTRARLQAAQPEVIIRPRIPANISIFWGFHQPLEAIEAGERAAEEALPKIRQALEVITNHKAREGREA